MTTDAPNAPNHRSEEKDVLDCTNSFCKGLNRKFNDENTSDVTLVVGSKRYHVHKLILAASSEYFERMFYGGPWKESADIEIILQETSASETVIDTFVRYFYTGVVNISPETAPDILKLADKYDAKVMQNCLEYMISTINKGDIDKALAWIPLCHQIKSDALLERCYVIVSFNLEKAAEMPAWLLLSSQDILNILKRTDIIVQSEYNVYIAVQNWVLSQTECPSSTMKAIFSRVEFMNMTTLELEQVEQSILATGKASGILTQHLHKAFRYLACKAENRSIDQACLSRVYTKGAKLQKVTFSDRSSSSIIPRYENDTRITRRYTWMLSYQHDYSKTATHFDVVVTKVTITGTTLSLSSEIEGTNRINMMVFLQNTQGITYSMTTTSTTTRMPTREGGSVVKFSVNDIHDKPKAGLVSFEINKI